MNHNFRRCAAPCLAVVVLLGACSSQNDSIPTPLVRPVNPAPAGIYTGEFTSARDGASTTVTCFVDGVDRALLFDETARLIQAGVYEVSNRELSWLARSFASDGADVSIATLSAQGSFEPQQTLLLAYDASDGDFGVISLSYEEGRYEVRSDLPLLAGTWVVEDEFGAVISSFSISQDGQLFGFDQAGCNYSGNFSLIDLHYNLYNLSLIEQCGAETSLEEGLATLLPVAPDQPVAELIGVTSSQSTASLLRLRQR